jgi:hypothetical protein
MGQTFAGASDSSSGCGFWDYFFGTCEPLTSAPAPPGPTAEQLTENGGSTYSPATQVGQSCLEAGGSQEQCAAAVNAQNATTNPTSNNAVLIVAALGIGALILFAAVQE